MVEPPSVPTEQLTDWRRTTDATETPFSALGLTVTARFLLYEDERLRTAIREETGVDRTWRFFLAARLTLDPTPPVTRTLRNLVANRASRGFVDRLSEREFGAVERVDRRPLRVGGEAARLFQYDARCRVDGLTLPVTAWLAVWAPGSDFRMAGGAYPTGVDSGAAEDTLADSIESRLDPTGFRSELFDLVRATH
jgi:hypothetical protein